MDDETKFGTNARAGEYARAKRGAWTGEREAVLYSASGEVKEDDSRGGEGGGGGDGERAKELKRRDAVLSVACVVARGKWGGAVQSGGGRRVPR